MNRGGVGFRLRVAATALVMMAAVVSLHPTTVNAATDVCDNLGGNQANVPNDYYQSGTACLPFPANEPDGAGTYNFLQIAEENTFRVYAKAGETISFTTFDGYGSGSSAASCGTISILPGGNSTTPVGGATVSALRAGGTTFTNANVPARSSTCSGAPNPYQWVTISYKVPNNGPFNVAGATMDSAYKLTFDPSSGSKTSDKSYKWRITVTDAGGNRKYGRVWFVGGDAGLKIHQDDTWGTGGNNTYMDFRTNQNFQFVRADGYRYALQYYNYQGIWSTFHGGVYGVRVSSGGADNNAPAYRSYDQQDGSYHFLLGSGDQNVAYVFLDCYGSTACPTDLTDASGNYLVRSQPITNDTAVVKKADGTTYNELGNPIPNPENTTAMQNFTYTGYTSGYAGGTVSIPFSAMQTGYINLSVTVDGTVVCQKQFLVDEADGAGVKTWTFTAAGLNSCDSGAWKTAAARPSPFTVSTSSKVVITVRATHLGEMHFIDVDTEQRGAIEVTSNDNFGGSSKMLGWYDPFSRIGNDICGQIPPRVGGVGLVGGMASGGMADNTSSDTSLWDSMSNESVWGSTSLIGRKKADTTGAANMFRQMVNSNGGVHGWAHVNSNDCDAYGSGDNDGFSNEDGTATTESTWGNNRVVDDWTYAVNDPAARVIKLGPTYNLIPAVSLSPASSISPSQSVQASPQVSKTGISPATGITWMLFEMVFAPGKVVDLSLRSDTDGTKFGCNPNGRTAVGALSCGAVESGSNVTFGNGNTTLTPYTKVNTAGLQVGSTICFALMVTPYDPDGGYREAVTCIVVAAAPYMSVDGGTAWAGGSTVADINGNYTGVATISGTSSPDYGSFGEYGVFATGSISLFGSAARLNTSNNLNMVSGSKLTFSNTAPTLGFWTNSHKITNLVAATPGCSLTGTQVINDTSYGRNTDLVICANVVEIRGNIRYDTAALSFKEVPSLTVIANTIRVYSNVTEIAGNFYAASKLVTCVDAGGGIPSGTSADYKLNGTCSKQLVVNGAVAVANQADGSLVLNRTYGGAQAGQPAEIVRMRPEVYLSKYEDNINPSLLRTVYETELPARY